MYRAIDINRQELTIMGVPFPDLKSLESTANALGSNMFEGFVPTRELVQIYLDLKNGKLEEPAFIARLQTIYG